MLPIAMLPIVFIGVISYVVSVNIMIDSTSNGTKNLQIQTTQTINYALQQVEVLMNAPLLSKQFMDTARTLIKVHSTDTSQSSEDMYRFLTQTLYDKPFIKGAFFLSLQGHTFGKSEIHTYTNTQLKQIRESTWGNRIEASKGTIQWDVSTQSHRLWDIPPGHIIVSRLLLDTYTLEPLGMYVILVSMNIISDQYKNLQFYNNSKFLVVSTEGMVISDSSNLWNNQHITSEPWYQNLTNRESNHIVAGVKGKQMLIIGTKIANTGWNLVSLIPYDELRKQATPIRTSTVVIVGISLMTILVFSLKYSTTIIRPVYQLITSMRKIESGQFTPIADVDSYTEITILARNYNSMVAYIQNLLQDVYESKIINQQIELRAVRSELKALQAQINPHFIYNTLECINLMAKSNGQQSISRMILSLAKILRINVNKGMEVIPIESELGMIAEYMFIQQCVYQDNIQFHVAVPDNVRKHPIVRFTLQPLIENSIRHGFADAEYKGVIGLCGCCEQDRIRLELTDNGVGMPESQLRQLNDQLQNIHIEESQPPAGYGILNVNSRIKLCFGNAYGLHYENIAPHGLKVFIDLPNKQ